MAATFRAATAFATLQALLQRIHQIDHVARPLLALGYFQRFAGGLAADQRLQGVLVLVLEFGWIEMPGLLIEDMASELDHVLRSSGS